MAEDGSYLSRMNMIEIARFADVYEAEIAAARLRAEGYDPVLGGAEHVKTDPLVLMALGGVNLSVPTKQAVPARRLLEALRTGAEGIEVEPASAARRSRRGPLAILLVIGLGLAVALTLKAPSIFSGPYNPFWPDY